MKVYRIPAQIVYPTLQLLEDEDLVTSVEENGKKVYTITEKGMDKAPKKTPIKNPWEKWDKGDIKFIKVRVADQTDIAGFDENRWKRR